MKTNKEKTSIRIIPEIKNSIDKLIKNEVFVANNFSSLINQAIDENIVCVNSKGSNLVELKTNYSNNLSDTFMEKQVNASYFIEAYSAIENTEYFPSLDIDDDCFTVFNSLKKLMNNEDENDLFRDNTLFAKIFYCLNILFSYHDDKMFEIIESEKNTLPREVKTKLENMLSLIIEERAKKEDKKTTKSYSIYINKNKFNNLKTKLYIQDKEENEKGIEEVKKLFKKILGDFKNPKSKHTDSFSNKNKLITVYEMENLINNLDNKNYEMSFGEIVEVNNSNGMVESQEAIIRSLLNAKCMVSEHPENHFKVVKLMKHFESKLSKIMNNFNSYYRDSEAISVSEAKIKIVRSDIQDMINIIEDIMHLLVDNCVALELYRYNIIDETLKNEVSK